MTPDNIARLAGKLLQVKTEFIMLLPQMPEGSKKRKRQQELEADLSLYVELMDLVERDARRERDDELANETRRVAMMMMGETAASKLINPHGSLSTAYSEEP